nr:rhomboid family intramembrane serine protease [Brevibacterium sp. 68QC2CO]
MVALTVLAYLANLLPGAGLASRLAFVPALTAVEPWRALTVVLVHAGPTHLLFNMVGLYFFGGFLEKSLGRFFVLGTYLVAALGGSLCPLLLSILWPAEVSPGTVFVGASGAVYGLVGVLLVPTRRLDRNWSGVLVFILLGALYPLFDPQVAWEAHLGGLITGFVLGGAYFLALRLRRRSAGRPDRTA